MSLDIHTTVTIAAVLALIVGASLRIVMPDYPAALLPSIRLWAIGTLSLPMGWLLYAQRNVLPDLLSIVVANGLLGLGFAQQAQAIRRFVGVPERSLLLWGSVAAIVACELVFTYLVPSGRLRAVTVSAIISAQMFAAIVGLGQQAQLARSHLLTGGAFLIMAVALAARALYEAVQAGPFLAPFQPSPMQTVAFSVGAAFPVAATLGFLLMCNDRLYRDLLHQATIDALTGISNRRTLDEQARRALAEAERHDQTMAMLMLDADHFKRINDAYGHEAGDEALQIMAAILQRSLRSEDLLGRLGGEEFVALLPQTDVAAAQAGAERLRRAIEDAEFHVGSERVPLRISIGIAINRSGDDFASLLRRADQALYAAKRAGRNRVVGPIEPVQPARHAERDRIS